MTKPHTPNLRLWGLLRLTLLVLTCWLAAPAAQAQIGFQQLGVYIPEDPSSPVAEITILDNGWRVVGYQGVAGTDKYTSIEVPFKLKAPYDVMARAFVIGPATLNLPELFDLTEISGYFLPNNRLVLLLPVISGEAGYKLVHMPFLFSKKQGK